MSGMNVYGSQLNKKTIKAGNCKHCNAEVFFAKTLNDKWMVFDKSRSEIAPKEENSQRIYSSYDNDIYKSHFAFCHPNGFRYNFGDKIIYAPYKRTEDGYYKIIGVDDYNCTYFLQNLKNLAERINPQLICFVDKSATPLDAAAELIYV